MSEILLYFSELRKILCICPCCGEIVRVSDLDLTLKKPTVKTWLDNYENKVSLLEKKEGLFDEKESKIREKSVEKGRAEAQKLVNTLIFPAFRKMKLNPFDVKPILNPVDYVAFNGMDKEETISDILFLSKKTDIKNLDMIRRQVQKVIVEKKYNWEVSRINEEGKLTFET